MEDMPRVQIEPYSISQRFYYPMALHRDLWKVPRVLLQPFGGSQGFFYSPLEDPKGSATAFLRIVRGLIEHSGGSQGFC